MTSKLSQGSVYFTGRSSPKTVPDPIAVDHGRDVMSSALPDAVNGCDTRTQAQRGDYASMSTITLWSSAAFCSGSVSAVKTPAPISLPARYFKRPGIRYAG